MRLFLSSLALTVTFGIWMIVVASSQLSVLDEINTIEKVSGAYSNPINRSLKTDRLNVGIKSALKLETAQSGSFCTVGGFERACKFRIAELKVSPPLLLTN